MPAQKKKTTTSAGVKTVRMTIPSSLGFEKLAMETAARLAGFAGIERTRQDDLCTAVSEACINAMQHGNQFSEQKTVEIVFRLKKKAFEVEVHDRGAGMVKSPDAPVLEHKLAKQDHARGWGVYLMERLVDRVEFRRKSGNKHVTRLTMLLT